MSYGRKRDVWYIELDDVADEDPMTLEEIAQRLRGSDYRRIRIMNIEDAPIGWSEVDPKDAAKPTAAWGSLPQEKRKRERPPGVSTACYVLAGVAMLGLIGSIVLMVAEELHHTVGITYASSCLVAAIIWIWMGWIAETLRGIRRAVER